MLVHSLFVKPEVPIYSTRAINADEWLAMASLFRSSQGRKFPLSLLQLHSITLTGPGLSTLHCFLLGTGFCVSPCFKDERKMKNNKVWRKPYVGTHKLPSFILLLIVVPTCTSHKPLEQSGQRELQSRWS